MPETEKEPPVDPATEAVEEREFLREVYYSPNFKRDFRREKKGRHRKTIEADFAVALELLANDKALPARYRDHLLTSNWKNHRDLHLKPDLVLIYKKPDPDPPKPNEPLLLQLIRLGSHSELGI